MYREFRLLLLVEQYTYNIGETIYGTYNIGETTLLKRRTKNGYKTVITI